MKKKGLYAAFLLMGLFIYTGCSSSDDDELWGNWVNIGDFDGYGRNGAVSFTIGGRAYVGTGYSGRKDDESRRLTDFWEFTESTNSWREVESFPGRPRNEGVAFSIGNKGYVGLGVNEDVEYFSDFYEYDSTTDTWREIKPFPAKGRSGAVAFSLNGKGYVGCGYDGSAWKDFYCYDPATEEWTPILSIGGSKREGASAFVIDNYAYVVGGKNNSQEVNDFWRFNGTTGEWEELRKIANVTDDSFDDDYTSIMRSFGAAFVINGKGYISTGEYNGYIRSTTWEYDPATDLWEELHAFEGAGRKKAVGFSVNNRGFILTGTSGAVTAQFDNMFEFFPLDEYNQYD